jgi:protein arginine kinase activator
MLCQSCGKNQANTHIKRVVNGDIKEYMLCEVCAEKLGYGNIFNDFNLKLDDFLGSFFTENIPHMLKSETTRCEKCGSSIEDISNSGKVGCANCYKVFYDKLIPSIKRIHGNTNHSGKLAANVSADKKIESKTKKLEYKLQEAIKEQNFEEAAKIRDKIKDLKKAGEING